MCQSLMALGIMVFQYLTDLMDDTVETWLQSLDGTAGVPQLSSDRDNDLQSFSVLHRVPPP